MKDVTLAEYLATQYGTSLSILVKIDFGSGSKYYGTKSFTNVTLSGLILDISNFNDINTESSSFNKVNVVINDTGLKTIFDSEQVLKIPVTIYLYNDTDGLTTAVTLFKGYISGDIVWSDSEMNISFEIDSEPVTRNVGFALEEDDEIDSTPIAPESGAIGQAWPMCFGSVLRVPALRITSPAIAEVENDVPIQAVMNIKLSTDENFPTDAQYFTCNGVLLQGTVANSVLTTTAANVSWLSYWEIEDIAIAARQEDDDEDNVSVLWITGSYNLSGKYCYTGTKFGYCYRQVDTKCWFNNSMYSGTQPSTITDVRGIYLTAWFTNTKSWPLATLRAGDKVYWTDDTNKTVKYVCNLFSSSSIKEVMAYRNIKDSKKLVAVPFSYYTKYLTHDVPDRYLTENPDANTTCTVIEFDEPLSFKEGEEWEDDTIYVTLVSSVSSNTATVIKTLLDYYSNIDSDSTTQSAIVTKLTKYPSHFTISSQDNVLNLVKSIAWQARCAVRYKNGTAYYIYLSEQPSSTIFEFDESNTLYKTLSITSEHSLDLTTKGKAKWQKNYVDEPLYYVKTNNVGTYGLKLQEFDFYIYNIESLVKKSLDFWMYRLSNNWKHCSIQTPINSLKCDVLDYVTLGYTAAYISTTDAVGLCNSINYDSKNQLISLEILTNVKTGSLTPDTGIWVSDAGDSTPTDPTTGLAEIDYVVNKDRTSGVSETVADAEDEVHKAFCAEDAGTGNTITCYLDEDTTGDEIEVTCELIGVTNLSDADPLLTTHQEIPVRLNGSTWECLWSFTGDSDLVSQWAIVDQIPVYDDPTKAKYVVHKLIPDGTGFTEDATDIDIDKALGYEGYESDAGDIRNWVPWYAVNSIVKIKQRYVSGTLKWFMDMPMMYTGPEDETNIRWATNKIQAVWA